MKILQYFLTLPSNYDKLFQIICPSDSHLRPEFAFDTFNTFYKPVGPFPKYNSEFKTLKIINQSDTKNNLSRDRSTKTKRTVCVNAKSLVCLIVCFFVLLSVDNLRTSACCCFVFMSMIQ